MKLPPAASPAEFPEILQSDMVAKTEPIRIPPQKSLAIFPEMVQSASNLNRIESRRRFWRYCPKLHNLKCDAHAQPPNGARPSAKHGLLHRRIDRVHPPRRACRDSCEDGPGARDNLSLVSRMSRRGDCRDRAVQESCFVPLGKDSSLKKS